MFSKPHFPAGKGRPDGGKIALSCYLLYEEHCALYTDTHPVFIEVSWSPASFSLTTNQIQDTIQFAVGSNLAPRVFLRVLPYFLLPQTPTLQIPIRPGQKTRMKIVTTVISCFPNYRRKLQL